MNEISLDRANKHFLALTLFGLNSTYAALIAGTAQSDLIHHGIPGQDLAKVDPTIFTDYQKILMSKPQNAYLNAARLLGFMPIEVVGDLQLSKHYSSECEGNYTGSSCPKGFLDIARKLTLE
jgi:hypothetical protein